MAGATASKLSFIEPHEVSDAENVINQQFLDLTGKPFDFRPAGFMIACKIYIRPDEIKTITDVKGEKKTLYLPDAIRTEDKYQSVAALVCAVGPQAYKGLNSDGTPRFPEGPWCRVADFVALPRYESFLVSYHGVAMALVPDDKILAVLRDPTDVTAIQLADKF